MGLEALAGMVVLGIVLVVALVHLTGRARNMDEADAGTALVEFGIAYPDEAIRAVVMSADRKTSFFRLADGKTGFLRAMGKHNVARLIAPGMVHVETVEPGPALKIGFRESGFPGGTYRFASAEDAAEVSLWLCGSFTLVDAGEAGLDAAPTGGTEGARHDV